MKIISKLFALAAILAFLQVFSVSIANADLTAPNECRPGQNPVTSFCIPAKPICTSWQNPQRDNCRVAFVGPTAVVNNLIVFSAVGVAVLIITIIAVVVLIKIRHKHA